MKNLKFLIIATILLFSSTTFAASNLWEFYNGELPTISERAEIYDLDDEYKGTAEQNTYLLGKLQGESGITLGGFRPSGYSGKLLTRLNEGGSETTFNTTPGTAPDGSSLTTAKIGDFVVLTINPGGANEEKISASAVSVSGTTATWTIINRGLSFTENAAVTANKNQHAIGETVIISNDDHYFKAQYAAIDEDVTITGDWLVPTPANATSIVNRNYVDGAAFGGIGLSSETATGTVEIATGLEVASSTTNGTLGRLVIPASLATSTYNSATAGLKVVATQNNGKIDNGFIATTTIGTPPTGTILSFTSSTTLPAGYLATNAQAVSRTTYSNLFGVIGSMYGIGDGSTTFNLPNISTDIGNSAIFDAQSTQDETNGSLSWSHTVSSNQAGNNILVVAAQAPVATNVTAATYNSVSMTPMGTTTWSGGNLHLYYLVNPTVGSNTIGVTCSAWCTGSAVSYYGIKATSPLDFSRGNSTTGASLTMASTTSQVGNLMLAAFANAYTTTQPTAGNDSVRSWVNGGGTGGGGVGFVEVSRTNQTVSIQSDVSGLGGRLLSFLSLTNGANDIPNIIKY